MERTGLGLGDLTIMGGRDPYRIGEKAVNHITGRWVRTTYDQLLSTTAPVPHIRGFHYKILLRGGVKKPDGQIYGHSSDDAAWLQNDAAKCARWLDYLPFEGIRDQRSDPPLKAPPEPAAIDCKPEITGTSAHVPDFDDPPPPSDIELEVDAMFPRRRNRFRLVAIGEKSGLADTIKEMAHLFYADTFTPAGEISDSHLAEIAADAAEDGRELVLLVIADADPAGRQMAISQAHKLRALRDLHYPDLRFRVIPLALEVEQAKALTDPESDARLPQSRLKDGDPRSARWRSAFGIEQVEIDAMVELMPGTLQAMIAETAAAFVDPSLADRTSKDMRLGPMPPPASWHHKRRKIRSHPVTR